MTEQTLWTTVDCACGKPPISRMCDSTPLVQINDKAVDLNRDLLVDAALDAIDHLSAQMQALQRVLEGVVTMDKGPSDAYWRGFLEEALGRLLVALDGNASGWAEAKTTAESALAESKSS